MPFIDSDEEITETGKFQNNYKWLLIEIKCHVLKISKYNTKSYKS